MNRYRVWLAGVLLLLLGSYYASSTLFFHQHTIDGQSVFHSHFSTKEHRADGGDDGGHSFATAKLIALLNNISLEEQSMLSHVDGCEWFVQSTRVVENTLSAKCDIARVRSLRAPPALTL